MFNEMKDSIKARLYDFQGTPFLASFVTSWIIINNQFFLIYFSKESVVNKMKLLNEFQINFWGPLAFALFYLFVYSWISQYFYQFTLYVQKKKNEKKQAIENQTLLSSEDSRAIRYENEKIRIELDEYIRKAESAKENYDKKERMIQNIYDEKEIKLKEELKTELKLKTSDLSKLVENSQEIISKQNSEIINLDERVEYLNKELESRSENKETDTSLKEIVQNVKTMAEKEVSLINDMSKEERQILSVFFDYDSSMKKDILKSQVLDKFKTKKVTTEASIKSLVNKKILTLSLNAVILTELGLKIVDRMFKKIK